MRSLPEWIGKTDDTTIPARVRLRIFDRYGGRCVHCTRRIGSDGPPHYDHIIAIANGGENRESNLQLLCVGCHSNKSHSDVRQKAVTYRKRLKHLGIKRRKGRPMAGSKDSPWKKKMDGTVVPR